MALLLSSGRYTFLESMKSPDGSHEIRIYKDRFFWGFPGSGSDAPGYVKLYFRKRFVDKYYVEMVMIARDIRWNDVEFDEFGRFVNPPIGWEKSPRWIP